MLNCIRNGTKENHKFLVDQINYNRKNNSLNIGIVQTNSIQSIQILILYFEF